MDNEILNLAFLLIGGLGIFLLGMHFTSDGLQKIAGAKMKKVMTGLTHNRVIGSFTGAGITAILQSSSFVSVMVVGLVSARLLNLTQAASLIVGMNVGTTITAQIIAFDVAVLSLPMIAAGVYMHLFTKKEGYHFAGQVLLGLGMLFLGLDYMKEAFEPLKTDPAFYDFFVRFGDNVLLALLVGVIATLVVQSSSAVIGISMALAASGLLAFPAAVAVVLGSNIGTTLTAQLAALKMNRTAKRAAMFHSIFNIVGVVLVMIGFAYFLKLVDWATPNEINSDNVARHLANSHTIFNILTMVVLLFVLPQLVRFVEWMIPKSKGRKIKGMFTLNKGYLKAPDIAFMQVKLACMEMIKVVKRNIDLCKNCPKELHQNEAKIMKNEDMINAYRKEISDYLGKLARQDLTEKQSQEVPVFLHLVNDVETMADELKRIVRILEKLSDADKNLTAAECRNFSFIMDQFNEYLSDVLSLLRKPVRNKVIRLEEEIIEFRKKKLDLIKVRHSYMSEIMEAFHSFTRKIANILVMTREI